MKILCRDLLPTLEQEIYLNLPSRYILGAISPFLVMVGAPSGTFTFGIYRGATTVFEEVFTSADIKTKLNTTYNHGYVYYPFNPNKKLKSGAYKIRITASGYTPTSSSFICWAQQHENIQNEMTYVPINDTQNSLTFRLKVYREGVL